MTDAQVVLARIGAGGWSGGVALDREAARASVARIASRLGATVERTAAAIVRAADAEMARALRRVSVDRGVDPRDCALVGFGGGGPLHACALADALAMRTVLVPPFAGVLSAVGLAIAPERREVAASLLTRTSALDATVFRDACNALAARVSGRDRRWQLRVRYEGQGHELEVAAAPGDAGKEIAARFEQAHRTLYGFTLPREVECVALRHVASEPGAHAEFQRDPLGVAFDAEGLVDRGGPAPSGTVRGPRAVTLPDATLWIAEGWTATALAIGGWRLDRDDA